MANWWDDAPISGQQPAQSQAQPQAGGNWWDSAPQSNPSQQPFTGSFLPVSRDAQGNISFDPHAGALGGILNGVTAPHDAMTGDLQVMGPDGNVSPEAIARGWQFAQLASPMTPGLRAGEGILGGPVKTKAPNIPVPTWQQQTAAGGAGFDAIRKLGVDYQTSSVNDLASRLQAELFERGQPPVLAPKTNSILDGLQENEPGSVASATNLISARRALAGAAQDFNNPSEQAAASHALEGLGQFISRPPPAAVIRGTADQVGSMFDQANANYAAGMRTKQLEDLKRAVEIKTNGANSARNAGNTTRQRVGSILLSPEQLQGYSPSEVAGLEGVNAGSTAANLTRHASNYLGGGGGLGQMITTAAGSLPGMMMGSPELSGAGAVALPALGHGLKELSNALTERQLDSVISDVAKRSPLYQAARANAPPPTTVLPTTSNALLRAMMLKQPQNQQSNQDWLNAGGT
jgi:hypothetical protein